MSKYPASTATLRITGRNLAPAEITRLLCQQPTRSWSYGDKIPAFEMHEAFQAEYGLWALEAIDRDPENIEGQIGELLAMVNPSTDVWRLLADQHDIDMFCGYFMYSRNHDLFLPPDTLLALGMRNIRLHLDIYERTTEDRLESDIEGLFRTGRPH